MPKADQDCRVNAPTKSSRKRSPLLGAVVLGTLVLGTLVLNPLGANLAASSDRTPDDNPQRYPYDPVCAWGRLADGHGMLIRCLGPQEASQLLQASLAEDGANGGAAEKPPPKENSSRNYTVSKVGPAVADTGELPLAAKKLSAPADRYVACVKQHGGLSAESGQVVVRFLVRERGRAEGVAVKSRRGMSEAAAKCIADVVDRRYVGYPAAPMVGATLPIELSVKN